MENQFDPGSCCDGDCLPWCYHGVLLTCIWKRGSLAFLYFILRKNLDCNYKAHDFHR